MSRIRSVHPGLWTDERFVSASAMARLFFMGIWNECDDFGSFEWAPLKLKMRLLPADNADASELLVELIDAGSIMQYEIGGKAYGAVRNFCQYQRPKKPNAIHPQTEQVRTWVNTDARLTRDGSEEVPNELPTGSEKSRQMKDGGGSKEGCSNEQPQPASGRGGKTLIPSNWSPPPLSKLPPRAKACAEQWPDASYQTEGEAFVCYWRSERKMKGDWNDTWANRIVQRHEAVMRAKKFGNAAPGAKPEKLSDAATIENLKKAIELYSKQGRFDEVREARRRIAELEGKASGGVASIIRQTSNGLAA